MGYDKSVFARNLLHYMKKNGETQADLVRFLGVSKSTVSAYCKGTQIPRIDKIELLAIHYRSEKSDLIEDKQPTVSDGLSEAEAMLLDAFRQLLPEQQDAVLVQLRALAQYAKAPGAPE